MQYQIEKYVIDRTDTLSKHTNITQETIQPYKEHRVPNNIASFYNASYHINPL